MSRGTVEQVVYRYDPELSYTTTPQQRSLSSTETA